MRETSEDFDRLQAQLDASRHSAGAHLRRAFGEAATTAIEVVRALDGIFEMHVAVVTAAGAPLVAPVDGILFHGELWFSLPGAAVRSALLRADPRVSASYTKGSTAFIVHGEARELDVHLPVNAEWDELVTELYVAQYGSVWIEWRDARRRNEPVDTGFTGWIEPRRFFAKT